MGTIISLEAHRAARHRGNLARRKAVPRATLFFDLASPYTYLAAERAERLFPRLEWQPACSGVLHAPELSADAMRAAGERADQLGLPLRWPEEPSRPVRGAMRAATLAAETGCAAAFVLAASRLAFCGGYDVDEPEILAEAAAAAGMGLQETLAAAGDRRRDNMMEQAALSLLAAGVQQLPAVRVGRLLFSGEERLHEAAAARVAV